MAGKGKESKPGDRGDATHASGLAKVRSGYAGNLSGECSKGYEAPTGGWGGNVRR